MNQELLAKAAADYAKALNEELAASENHAKLTAELNKATATLADLRVATKNAEATLRKAALGS